MSRNKLDTLSRKSGIRTIVVQSRSLAEAVAKEQNTKVKQRHEFVNALLRDTQERSVAAQKKLEKAG